MNDQEFYEFMADNLDIAPAIYGDWTARWMFLSDGRVFQKRDGEWVDVTNDPPTVEPFTVRVKT